MSLLEGPTTPVWLQRMQILLAPVETWTEWKRLYGDNFKIGHEPPVFCISTPKAIEAVLKASPEQISSCQTSAPMKAILGDNSILFLDGKRHQRERKLLMPMFHKESILQYNQIICSTTKRAVEKLEKGRVIKVASLMNDITLSVLLKAVFGLKDGELYIRLKKILGQISALFSNPLFSIASLFPIFRQPIGIWQKFLELRQELEQLLLLEIKTRRSNPLLLKKDIFSLLISARDEFGQPLPEDEIRDQLLTFVLSGYETTSAALTWALYWTNYQHNNLVQLKKEINSASLSEPEEVAKLPFLNALCQETLRFYPIAMNAFSRQTKKPMEIDNIMLPPQTNINISIFMAHRNEKTFPNADEFIPQRFLERQFSPYEFLPFGGGDRRCLGASLAWQEIKLILANIVSMAQFEIINPHLLRPVRYGVAMIPPRYLSMRLIDKQV